MVMNIACRRISVAALAVSLLAVMSPAMAQTEAGRLLFARGVVSIVGAQDSARGARTGDVIYEGERLVTGRSGIAQLRLSDGALVALRASSDYHIQRQGYDTAANVYEQAGQLVTGWMRMVTGAIGARNPSSVSQSTSVATIGIRGTVFQVIHIPEGGLPGYPGTAPGTYLMLEEGSIEVMTDGGKRLLQPGDVIWVADKGAAPQLAPEKKGLFSNPLGGEARYVDLQDTGIDEFTNETLRDTLIVPRPFERAGALGWMGGDGILGFADYSGSVESSFATSGEGSGRVMTYLSDFDAEATGSSPASRGYYLLADGSEINWGVWRAQDYLQFGGSADSDWHYMMASNVLSGPETVSGLLTGQATYQWVGGTNFMNDLGETTDKRITGGQAQVDFGASTIYFDLSTNFTSGNLTNSACISAGCSISDLYFGAISVSDGENYSGSIGGAFVGDGTGIITKISVNSFDQSEYYYGTAAFAGYPDQPVFEEPAGP
jgi:hypothetical protein